MPLGAKPKIGVGAYWFNMFHKWFVLIFNGGVIRCIDIGFVNSAGLSSSGSLLGEVTEKDQSGGKKTGSST